MGSPPAFVPHGLTFGGNLNIIILIERPLWPFLRSAVRPPEKGDDGKEYVCYLGAERSRSVRGSPGRAEGGSGALRPNGQKTVPVSCGVCPR